MQKQAWNEALKPKSLRVLRNQRTSDSAYRKSAVNFLSSLSAAAMQRGDAAWQALLTYVVLCLEATMEFVLRLKGTEWGLGHFWSYRH